MIFAAMRFHIFFVLSFLYIGTIPVIADTFLVTNTNDDNSAPYDGPVGSLRRAIYNVNLTPGPHRIEFRISNSPYGMKRIIHLVDQLPQIFKQVTIDGTTESGYNPDEDPLIVIDGGGTVNTALILDGCSGSVVQGIHFTNFEEWGIISGDATNDVIIRDNVFTFIGTPGLAGFGIDITDCNGCKIYNNYIGLTKKKDRYLSTTTGIFLGTSENCQIGGSESGQPNFIYVNAQGVSLQSSSHEILISRNEIWVQNPYISSDSKGIFLQNGQANRGILKPTILEVVGGTNGYIKLSATYPSFRVEIFRSRGKQTAIEFLGDAIRDPITGYWFYSGPFDNSDIFTATATSTIDVIEPAPIVNTIYANNTSELSDPVTCTKPAIEVTSCGSGSKQLCVIDAYNLNYYNSSTGERGCLWSNSETTRCITVNVSTPTTFTVTVRTNAQCDGEWYQTSDPITIHP